ncbi:DUF4440 domain-containing protein [Brevibacillus fluminis]|uniref:DUF4440 domain-containing protein n=1 Tax=Brevibacillus fluminis TaxID=511487 RepID=A0A3M8DT66_9BACL|nr:DUF4440 domain-containing protein [Brevibacillus fluminis]RNB91373.1 DUF4440 domain-containing protein [Brevibacillus fluminis]
MDRQHALLTGHQQDAKAIQQIESLTAAFFRAFTNKGMEPPVETICQLFVPGGIVIRNTTGTPDIYSLREFIEPRKELLMSGTLTDFEEEELDSRTEIFGNIAHRFSLYRKAGIQNGAAFEAKGMKTLQFVSTPEGWKLCSVAWDDEREGLAVPE